MGQQPSVKLTVDNHGESSNPYTLGDVNGDGSINLTDAVYILFAYNEEKTLKDVQKLAADINKDMAVDLTDALQILKYFNKEISSF